MGDALGVCVTDGVEVADGEGNTVGVGVPVPGVAVGVGGDGGPPFIATTSKSLALQCEPLSPIDTWDVPTGSGTR